MIFKNTFTFGRWCHYALEVTVTWCYGSHGNGNCACISFMRKTFRSWPNPSWCMLHRGLKTKWDIFQTAARDSYFWKIRNDWGSEKNTTTNLNRNHVEYPTIFPRSWHTEPRIGFSSALVPPTGFLPRGQSILCGSHSSLNRTTLQCLAVFLFE